ncbi:hypothetical protein TNCV_4106221 [Trichonephila clavipes]|nr:hypothetical protein TNCV_4106221 [Trichonephila clavipes]
MALDVGSRSGVSSTLWTTLLIARSSRKSDPVHSPSVIHCCQHRYLSLRPRWPKFDQPFFNSPYQSPSAARTAAGYVLGILSIFF